MRLPARGSEFRVWGVGLRAEGLELRGLRFRVSGMLELGVYCRGLNS